MLTAPGGEGMRSATETRTLTNIDKGVEAEEEAEVTAGAATVSTADQLLPCMM